MKVLFIGKGLASYGNQQLNALIREGVEVYNLVDKSGIGHAPSTVRQTHEDTDFPIIELEQVVVNRFSDRSYWNFKGMAELLQKIQPDIVSISDKYMGMFMYDQNITSIARAQNIKLVLDKNPFQLEKYIQAKADIESGKKDSSYKPYYVLYFGSLCRRLGLNVNVAENFAMSTLKFLGILTSRRIRQKLLDRLEEMKRLLNFVDAHTSYIEKAYDIYASYGVPREKIFIRYNSPDTDLLFSIREKIEKEPAILPPNPHRLIHVGRLIPWKRVDLLINSTAALRSEFPDIELLVIGKGPQEQELKDLTKKLGVEDKVKFIGAVYEPAVLGKYLMSSSIYVLAGMGGISINDAMAFGRPIVCSICDGTEEELVYEGENGMYFKNGNGEDLTKTLLQMLSDQSLLQRMGERSTEIVKTKMNLHTVVNGYLQAFRYVTKNS